MPYAGIASLCLTTPLPSYILHALHSQTEQVEWLLSLISMLYDVIVTALQGVSTLLL